MIPLLLFLLTIAILGTVIYLYLRQEQNKVIVPKDKYDETWNEFYKNKRFETRLNKSNFAEKSLLPLKCILLFLGTFGAALLINIFSISIFTSPIIAGLVLIGGLFSVGMFPYGLFAAFVPKLSNSVFDLNNPNPDFSSTTIMVWLPYIFIFLLGIYVENRRAFTFIYLIFIALLIMNIIGCTRILQETDFSGLS